MDYSTWSIRPDHLDKSMVLLYERFLLGSLATGASMMSLGFIDALHLSNSSLAQGYLTRLAKGGCKIEFKENAADVEAVIEGFGCDPWDDSLSTCFIGTRSEKVETLERIKALPEYAQSEGSNLSEETTPLIKRRFIEVDSVYRHLRNALAHGCFRQIEQEGDIEDKLFLFDIDKNDSVSCCALLNKEILDSWYSIACNVAETKL